MLRTMEDEDESLDTLAPLPACIDQQLIEEIMVAKNCRPEQFPSYWELDEEDIDEATEEEIQNNPSLRILWAAENNKLEVVQELLERDAALVMSRDDDGYTPLHRASYNDHLEVVKFLIDHGAEVEARTNENWTPLHSASNWGNPHIASYLISRGAHVNSLTNGNQTALHLAAANSNSRHTIELLLMSPGVDYTIKNALGETAKDLAERSCPYHALFRIAETAVNQLKS